MQIELINTGKRYNREWIFRSISYRFASPGHYAITGSNGSGKSTLLQVIGGATTHSEGEIQYTFQGKTVSNSDAVYRHLAIAAPYLELIEEMTALELLQFHHGFKPLSLPVTEILSQVQLGRAADKQIRYFSSGMKQRLKLAQAFFSETPLLLLDEPTSNLDADGIAIYHRLIETCTNNRLVLISSNDPQEYESCSAKIKIEDYKPAMAD